MVNEWSEFLQYTGTVAYTASGKRDTSFLGRFTWDTLLDFEGLTRVLTILARGYLFHLPDGSLADDPHSRIEYARRALCAWCSVPDVQGIAPKKDWRFRTDFRGLHDEFPELVDENGGGWFWRHVHRVADFVENNPKLVSSSAADKAQKIKKGFDQAWWNKVRQFQVPLYSPSTKGQWIIRFDVALADGLEAGPLRMADVTVPEELEDRIRAVLPKGLPPEVVCTLIAYYAANKPEDSDWVVLPVASFDAYFGTVSFGRKYLRLIPGEILERPDSGFGVCRYRVREEYRI